MSELALTNRIAPELIQELSTLDRPEFVRQTIIAVKSNLMSSAIMLGRMLKEARDNNYAAIWGYPSWGDWVEQSSGLDMSSRAAYYLVATIGRCDSLGLPEESVMEVKYSSLKEIMAIPEDQATDDEIRELVEQAKTMPYSQVRQAVADIRQTGFETRSYKFSKEDLEQFVEPAIERARLMYGDSVGPDGNAADISAGRALALALSDWLLTVAAEDDLEENTLEAEFDDEAVTEEDTEDSAFEDGIQYPR